MRAARDDDMIQRYDPIRYDRPDEVFRPWDARFPAVARRVADLIRARMPDARVEHIGSSAVPACAGKGIVDLLLLYPSGRLAAARDALDELGFQRQGGRDPFPEERPMRLGALAHDGTTFRLHVHVVAADAPEASELLGFRDRLRTDPAQVADYVARKRAVLAAGAEDNIAYNRGKRAFIQGVIGAPDLEADDA